MLGAAKIIKLGSTAWEPQLTGSLALGMYVHEQVVPSIAVFSEPDLTFCVVLQNILIL